MGIRDDELKRLEQYARGFGNKVSYRRHKKGDPGAAWILSSDGTAELILYTYPDQSKTMLILNFVHELGHSYSFIRRSRKEDPAIFEAFHREGLRLSETDPKLPKAERKLIYEAEKADAKYRYAIWHEVNIKIPKWKLDMDIALDIWGYKQYYLRGNHHNGLEMEQKTKELRKLYDPSKNKKATRYCRDSYLC